MFFALLATAIVGAGLGLMLGAAYAVPIRRTYRKEHDLPLTTPGPELRDPTEGARTA